MQIWRSLLKVALSSGVENGSQLMKKPVKQVISEGIQSTEIAINAVRKAGQIDESRAMDIELAHRKAEFDQILQHMEHEHIGSVQRIQDIRNKLLPVSFTSAKQQIAKEKQQIDSIENFAETTAHEVEMACDKVIKDENDLQDFVKNVKGKISAATVKHQEDLDEFIGTLKDDALEKIRQLKSGKVMEKSESEEFASYDKEFPYQLHTKEELENLKTRQELLKKQSDEVQDLKIADAQNENHKIKLEQEKIMREITKEKHGEIGSKKKTNPSVLNLDRFIKADFYEKGEKGLKK